MDSENKEELKPVMTQHFESKVGKVVLDLWGFNSGVMGVTIDNHVMLFSHPKVPDSEVPTSYYEGEGRDVEVLRPCSPPK